MRKSSKTGGNPRLQRSTKSQTKRLHARADIYLSPETRLSSEYLHQLMEEVTDIDNAIVELCDSSVDRLHCLFSHASESIDPSDLSTLQAPHDREHHTPLTQQEITDIAQDLRHPLPAARGTCLCGLSHPSPQSFQELLLDPKAAVKQALKLAAAVATCPPKDMD
eukprot:gnl/Dysnectes_brevis/5421_a7783_469.p1 GENE.gnl/Dysnectes_brevis/5421_a7783_469~~gnl/Dysnectes_brevis/5421_a7783_469.p1  ORF type:complete len:165 (-),score=40.14 gnl/Dysnectes_brevis/5421_a7783_469:142-636(-)